MNGKLINWTVAAGRAVVLIAVLLSSACQPSVSGRLSVREAWARPAAAGATSAIYLIVDNGTAQAERLLSVDTPAAAQAEFHESQMNDQNMMSMQPRESVAIPAGGQVAFAPGGLHVMLVGVTSELKAGDTFSITLHFENAGALPVEVPVQAP